MISGGVRRADARPTAALLGLLDPPPGTALTGLDPAWHRDTDVHSRVRSGEAPTEGTPAGVTMVAAPVSAFTGRPVRGLAMNARSPSTAKCSRSATSPRECSPRTAAAWAASSCRFCTVFDQVGEVPAEAVELPDDEHVAPCAGRVGVDSPGSTPATATAPRAAPARAGSKPPRPHSLASSPTPLGQVNVTAVYQTQGGPSASSPPLLITGRLLPLRVLKSKLASGQGRRNGSERGTQAESLQCISARIVSVPSVPSVGLPAGGCVPSARRGAGGEPRAAAGDARRNHHAAAGINHRGTAESRRSTPLSR